jgi:site-specific recombinase XerD
MDTKMPNKFTIRRSIIDHLDNIRLSRSENTTKTYANALNAFQSVLESKGINPEDETIQYLSEDAIVWFAKALKSYSPATERLYLTAATGFYEYISAEKLSEINLPRLRLLIQQRARQPGQRLPQFPRDEIEKLIEYAQELRVFPSETEPDRLRNLRDRAFMLVLADTGLRVHEACDLRRGDIDWNEGKAVITGKGNRQAVVRFSSRSLGAIKDYINSRAVLDGNSGRALSSLPLFARHDRGAGNKVKPITTTTGRSIVKIRVRECIGEIAVGSITPHSFRHYFVTTVLRGSGGNLKLAQELARHKNISVTQRYAHLADDELDKGYYEIFEEQ